MDNMLGIFVSNDGMCYMIEMTMMEGIVYGDGSYIDPFMVSEELMDLSMNAELSPMTQNFLTIVSNAMIWIICLGSLFLMMECVI